MPLNLFSLKDQYIIYPGPLIVNISMNLIALDIFLVAVGGIIGRPLRQGEIYENLCCPWAS